MINLSYTFEQKKDALVEWGYRVERESREFSRSIYHNDVEHYNRDVWVVYNKDGTEWYKGYADYGAVELVERAFDREFSERLLKLVLPQTKVENEA